MYCMLSIWLDISMYAPLIDTGYSVLGGSVYFRNVTKHHNTHRKYTLATHCVMIWCLAYLSYLAMVKQSKSNSVRGNKKNRFTIPGSIWFAALHTNFFIYASLYFAIIWQGNGCRMFKTLYHQLYIYSMLMWGTHACYERKIPRENNWHWHYLLNPGGYACLYM